MRPTVLMSFAGAKAPGSLLDGVQSFPVSAIGDFLVMWERDVPLNDPLLLEEKAAALHMAIARGRDDVVRFFLEKDFDANGMIDGMSALCYAVSCGNETAVQLLLESNADVNSVGDSPAGSLPALHWAARGGVELAPILKLLLDSGANISAIDGEGHSALHLAACCGNDVGVRMLLAAGASGNIVDSSGVTPLMFAALSSCSGEDEELDNCRAASALVEHGVDVMRTDADGSTALHHAAHSGQQQVASLVIQAIETASDQGSGPSTQSPLDVQNSDGWTALHFASSKGDLEMVKRLVSAGITLDIADAKGMSAIDWAKKLGNEEIASFLKNGSDARA